jgi:hypothetical protein
MQLELDHGFAKVQFVAQTTGSLAFYKEYSLMAVYKASTGLYASNTCFCSAGCPLHLAKHFYPTS